MESALVVGMVLFTRGRATVAVVVVRGWRLEYGKSRCEVKRLTGGFD